MIKQVIRADGTREAPQIAAYMDRDPDIMEAVIRGERLPVTVGPDDGIFDPHPVLGACTHGEAVIKLLNSVPEDVAQRIVEINERQVRALKENRS